MHDCVYNCQAERARSEEQLNAQLHQRTADLLQEQVCVIMIIIMILIFTVLG
jgi:hypothetical protein